MDRVHVSHDDAESILDWAISTGALLHLVYYGTSDMTPEEELKAVMRSIGTMLENMPEVMQEPVVEWAQECYNDAMKDEEIVDTFKEQLDQLTVDDLLDPGDG